MRRKKYLMYVLPPWGRVAWEWILTRAYLNMAVYHLDSAACYWQSLIDEAEKIARRYS